MDWAERRPATKVQPTMNTADLRLDRVRFVLGIKAIGEFLALIVLGDLKILPCLYLGVESSD